MWSLRLKDSGEFYLTYDRERRFTRDLRGRWEFLGEQSNAYIPHVIRTNENNGYLCCNDDEGGVRILVLE